MIQLGTMVKWSSQAQASTKTKTGEVVEVVQAGSRPDRALFPDLYRGAGVGMGRDHESYVVRVDVGKKPGKTFRHYWPRANALEAL